MMKMNALPSKLHKDKSMISLQDALLLVLSKNLPLAPRVNMMMRSSFLSISIVLYNPLHPVLMYTKNDDHDVYFYYRWNNNKQHAPRPTSPTANKNSRTTIHVTTEIPTKDDLSTIHTLETLCTLNTSK